MEYKGSCHCGAVQFHFAAPQQIVKGLRCNCSICRRKGALMTPFTMHQSDFTIQADDEVLGCYQFGTGTAQHYFCRQCGIYTFHQSRVKPGEYRANIGCLEGVDSTRLEYDVFDGDALLELD